MRPLLFALLLAAAPLGTAFAQVDEDDLFGGVIAAEEDPADTPTDPGTDPSDEESLFSDDGGIVTDVEENPAANPTEDLLTSEAVVIGGRFGVSVEGNLDIGAGGETTFSSGVADLSTRLFLDARPNSDLRVLAKGDLGYSTASGAAFELAELFADTDLDNTVFVRAGKQTINWGVGYFYSPANLINLERVDPENPGEELAGPAALRAQVPFGTDNLTGYVLTDDLNEDLNLSAAARYETLLLGFEVTTGGIAEAGGAWAVMGTASGSALGVSVFAETVLEGNLDKVFVVGDDTAPSGLGTTESESLFVSGTLGGRYTFTTDDELFSVTATAQYFFNGKGYEDPSVLTDNPGAVAALVGSGALSPGDLLERGRHYLGSNVLAPDVGDTGLSPSVLWLANLSDGSGLVNVGVDYAPNDYLTPRVGYRYTYGAAGSEYNFGGGVHRLSVGFDVSGAF